MINDARVRGVHLKPVLPSDIQQFVILKPCLAEIVVTNWYRRLGNGRWTGGAGYRSPPQLKDWFDLLRIFCRNQYEERWMETRCLGAAYKYLYIWTMTPVSEALIWIRYHRRISAVCYMKTTSCRYWRTELIWPLWYRASVKGCRVPVSAAAVKGLVSYFPFYRAINMRGDKGQPDARVAAYEYLYIWTMTPGFEALIWIWYYRLSFSSL